MPKFETIKEGETLLDCHRTRMGNTTMSEWSLFKVRVVSIDKAARTAMCSWNGNTPKLLDEHQLKRLVRKEPKAHRDQQERRKRTGSWF